ncbi:hypothetical protein BJY01DRAFT_256526 [Aspergillus pseudoustus]|uniref:Uncharacterized protein n=1 Tax=Aspergillus pseudoustus TaxID=1810923 RepID=A0ABR4IAV5_9EURO
MSMIGLLFSYHPPTYDHIHKGNPVSDKVKAKDWIGLITITIAFGMIEYSLLWVKSTYPWSSRQVIAVLVIGVVTLIGFFVYEYFWGGNDAAYAAYLIQSWHTLSQIAVGCLASTLLWFMPVASKLLCATVLGWGDWPAIWIQYEPRFVPRLIDHIVGLLLQGRSAGDPVHYSPAQLQVAEDGPIFLYYLKAAIVSAGTESWEFLFYIANIYVGLMITLAVASANTDEYLSSDTWVNLNRFRFPYYRLRPWKTDQKERQEEASEQPIVPAPRRNSDYTIRLLQA